MHRQITKPVFLTSASKCRAILLYFISLTENNRCDKDGKISPRKEKKGGGKKTEKKIGRIILEELMERNFFFLYTVLSD